MDFDLETVPTSIIVRLREREKNFRANIRFWTTCRGPAESRRQPLPGPLPADSRPDANHTPRLLVERTAVVCEAKWPSVRHTLVDSRRRQ